jgi:hypothetical protein
MRFTHCLLTFCALCLTSCSVKTSLGYNSVIDKQQENHITLCIPQLEDERSLGQQVGALRNIFGMPIIKIVTEDNIPEWITDALRMELAHAGYTISDIQGEQGYLIEGKILKVFASTYFIYHGRLTTQLSLKKDDQILFQKIYENKESNGMNCIAQASSCAEALKLNLQEMCKQFIADINEELRNHPTVH